MQQFILLFPQSERILTEFKAPINIEPTGAVGKCPSCDDDRDIFH